MNNKLFNITFIISFYFYVKILSYSSLDWIYQVSEKNINSSWLEVDLNLSLVSTSILITVFIWDLFWKRSNGLKILILGYIVVTIFYIMLCIEAWITFNCFKWICYDHIPDILGRLKVEPIFGTNNDYFARYAISKIPYRVMGSFHIWIDSLSYIGSFVLFSFVVGKMIKKILIWMAVIFDLKKNVWKNYFNTIGYLHLVGQLIFLGPVLFMVACTLSKDLACLALEIIGAPISFWMVIWHPLFLIPLFLKIYIFSVRVSLVHSFRYYFCIVIILTSITFFDIAMAKSCLTELVTLVLDNPEDSWGEVPRTRPFGLLSCFFWIIKKSIILC